jgi:uncharacterized glyoxalase superfamily protein PhnB
MAEIGWTAIPILGVRNVRGAAEYYRDVLGFDLDPETGVFGGGEDEEGGVYAIVRRGGCEIHFQIRRLGMPAEKRQSIERDVYVRVPSVAALHDELRERGAELAGPPARAPYGLLELEVTDPNGYRLTFGAES